MTDLERIAEVLWPAGIEKFTPTVERIVEAIEDLHEQILNPRGWWQDR